MNAREIVGPMEASDSARLQARLDALVTLQDVAREVSAELELDRLLHKILRAAVTVVKCSAGSLLLFDPATDELVFEVVEGGGGEELEKTRMPSDRGIAGAAFTSRRPLITQDAAQDQRHLSSVARRFGISVHALMALPLIAQTRAIGVLEVMNKLSGSSFSQEDQDLLVAFASQSAIAIENARLYTSVIKERDRMLSVEAAVHREVARDLHDGPAQLLAAMIMAIRNLNEVTTRAPERVAQELIELEALGQKALYQLRNILFDLRPVILETEGLRRALESYVERLRLVEPFNVELEASSLKSRFRPNDEAAIFSIVQEAVSNAKKHASPHNVCIKAQELEGYLTITISDDGSGFELADSEKSYSAHNSFGLLNMHERAEITHGALLIDSELGYGTTVTLRVPLSVKHPH